MPVLTHHFKVDNGDMSLFELSSGRKMLIDINIREPGDDIADVHGQLRKLLSRDANDRLYVDVMLQTHPDSDHIRGFEKYFHTGPLEDWSEKDDKIVVREMWSSPMAFRRASKNLVLCADAKAWAAEARRRVREHRNNNIVTHPGDHIQVLGADVDGKTDDLGSILVKTGTVIDSIAGQVDGSFKALLLGPLNSIDDDDEEVLTKNNSSVVLQMTLAAPGNPQAAKYLYGGDAEVVVWEKMWATYPSHAFQYDILLSPHHCSWHSLSHDSWSKDSNPAVAPDAKSALSQALPGARVLASSKEIKDNNDDPPCYGAKLEYESIVNDNSVDGEFICLAEQLGDEPFTIEVTANGPRPKRVEAAAIIGAADPMGRDPLGHG